MFKYAVGASGAILAPIDRPRYRYLLWRYWDRNLPALVFIMLNPSVADAVENDPTIARCIKRARLMGYGGIIVVNLFALISTDPKKLPDAIDPVGPDNNATLKSVFKAARDQQWKIIAGWGIGGLIQRRGDDVVRLAQSMGVDFYALRLSTRKQPYHPLYVSYGVQPFLWKPRPAPRTRVHCVPRLITLSEAKLP